MKYSFGEIKKTLTAAAGLVATLIGYVIADENLRDLFPPQWIALGGGILTVLGVFGVTNKEKPAADRAVTSIQETVQQAVTATAAVQQVKQTVDDLLKSIPGGSLVEQVIKSIPKF